jgi:hypothetical protein
MGLDLFTPIVPPTRFHPAFSHILQRKNEYDREVLEQWAEGFVDRDGKFVTEFQTTFDSSFWEIYLNALFRELGFRCDFTKSRPDFCIEHPLAFNVEATVALNARGAATVLETDPLNPPREFAEFNRQAILRLSNSLHAKHAKYVESYRDLPHVVGRPFVLALAPFDRPHFQLQAQRAIEALLYRYYVNEDEYLKEHSDRRAPLFAHDLPFVEKDSGEQIPIGLFCDGGMSEISAIITEYIRNLVEGKGNGQRSGRDDHRNF